MLIDVSLKVRPGYACPPEALLRAAAQAAAAHGGRSPRRGQDEGGDLLYTFTRVWSDGTMGIKLFPLELLEKLAALVPPPRVHPVRYAGGLAAHRKWRGTLTPTSRQQGIETPGRSVSSHWGWARLLKRVFSIDLERCPLGLEGTLRIIAAIPCRPVLFHILASHSTPSQAGGGPPASGTGPLGARAVRLVLCLNSS